MALLHFKIISCDLIIRYFIGEGREPDGGYAKSAVSAQGDDVIVCMPNVFFYTCTDS